MEIMVERRLFTGESTTGELSVDGVFECYTLEDVCRARKIPACTAIPYGRYEIAISFSNKFKTLLPLLINVPNFEGVRIHPGNKAVHTDGCILVGSTLARDFVGASRSAFAKLFAKVKTAIKSEKLFLTIIDGRARKPG